MVGHTERIRAVLFPGVEAPCAACYKITDRYIFPKGPYDYPDSCCRECFKAAGFPKEIYIMGDSEAIGVMQHKFFLKYKIAWFNYMRNMSQKPQTKINKAIAMLGGYDV